jgi:hypothetical protein
MLELRKVLIKFTGVTGQSVLAVVDSVSLKGL